MTQHEFVTHFPWKELCLITKFVFTMVAIVASLVQARAEKIDNGV